MGLSGKTDSLFFYIPVSLVAFLCHFLAFFLGCFFGQGKRLLTLG